MFDSAIRTFFAQWARNPVEIGSIVPSGDSLAKAVAKQIEGVRDGTIVELGGGTGTVTRALLDAGVQRERLLVVERNPRMIDYLRRCFPDVRITEGDASRLGAIARRQGLEGVAAVVSGLPLRLISDQKRYAIFKQAFDLLENHGPFVQFSYGPLAPMPLALLRRLRLDATKVSIVWLNLPPAAIWRFERPRTLSDAPWSGSLAYSWNSATEWHGIDRRSVTARWFRE